MSRVAHSPVTDFTLDPFTRYTACKGMAKGYAETIKSDVKRLEHARQYCAVLVQSFWLFSCANHNVSLKVLSQPATSKKNELPADVLKVAEDTGKVIALFPIGDAAFLIGSIYTTMMPNDLRAQMGAFHTPPPLVDRLIEMAEVAGFDPSKHTVIDPSCGGGAFLVPVALRMLKAEAPMGPKFLFKRIVSRLKGIELDPFSAWIARVVLEIALLPLCISAKSRLPEDTIVCGDALEHAAIGKYDLVIGNPPYGRVTLSEKMREFYSRSLYGHANLYGLFTDLALRLVTTTGVIAYLTPTSFLGGKYFMNLRSLLSADSTPISFDLVSDRDNVFDNVLQETILATFKAGKHKQLATVSSLIPKGMHTAEKLKIGTFSVPSGKNPWLIPRSSQDSKVMSALAKMPTRLSDLGYKVSTGQLVWNRFKPQLKSRFSAKTIPLIWAESVTQSGFGFSAEKRNHAPYFELAKKQDFLVTKTSCVLVQRTTSIEQSRRLIAAVIPQEFIDLHGGVVVENHLNMVYANNGSSTIPIELIEILLNSKIVDQVFRCISGSVAVSAYELNSLPLPNEEQLNSLALSWRKGAKKEFLENKIATFYGVSQG
jgi:hypothetical protein